MQFWMIGSQKHVAKIWYHICERNRLEILDHGMVVGLLGWKHPSSPDVSLSLARPCAALASAFGPPSLPLRMVDGRGREMA